MSMFVHWYLGMLCSGKAHFVFILTDWAYALLTHLKTLKIC